MTAEDGRLTLDVLSSIRGGAGSANYARDEVAQYIQEHLSAADASDHSPAKMPIKDVVDATFQQRYDLTEKMVKDQVGKIEGYNRQMSAIAGFGDHLQPDKPIDISQMRTDLGAKMFDRLFGNMLKSGEMVDGRPLGAEQTVKMRSMLDSTGQSLTATTSIEQVKLQDLVGKLNQLGELSAKYTELLKQTSGAIVHRI